MATVSQEKPSWVTNIEKQREEMGLPTVSSGSNRVSGGASSYTPAGAGSDYYAGQVMSGSDQALLKSYGDNWNAATTQAERDYWHEQAETLRNSYGYKGGTDGSQYINLMQQPLQSAQTGSGYDLTAYLRQAYAAKLESELAGLKVAYEKSMAGYDDQADRLPQQYDAARNSVAAQDALARKAFDERAAASGLSSGAAGQAELARSSAYQRDIANLDQAQANALSDIELQKANLQSQYESAIAQARADGNAALANALYEELVRVQGLNREDAQIEAERELAELELAMKYAAKGSSGRKTGTKTGGDDEKKDTTSLILPNVDTDEKDKRLYEKYSANPAPDTSQRDTSAYWSSVTPSNKQSGGKGYDNGSLTASQVKEMQAFYGLTQDGLWGPNSQKTAGSADEAWAKYQQEKGKPENALTAAGQNLYYQLQSIPGLTSENKVAMIEDALDKKRIEDTDADWLLNYLGY